LSSTASDCTPETLADSLLFRHIHPLEHPGKTMLQFIDPDSTLRIDAFRASGGLMSRTERTPLPSGPIRIVSLEDLAARAARLVLDLVDAIPVPSKHAHDYLRVASWWTPRRSKQLGRTTVGRRTQQPSLKPIACSRN